VLEEMGRLELLQPGDPAERLSLMATEAESSVAVILPIVTVRGVPIVPIVVSLIE
jgi:hypothetical protein